MKKVLYLSNVEVPYRVRLFNELSKHCDLTVLYEQKRTASRNRAWSESEEKNFRCEYLGGINIGAENSFSFKAVRKLFEKYDVIIVGCYNSPAQMMLILLMRMMNKPYILNLDGEIFAEGKGIKTSLKKFFLRGARKYLVAGKVTGQSLRKAIGDCICVPYYFSSLSNSELKANAVAERCDNKFILVVSQYLHVKGADLALECAKRNPQLKFKFVGMGHKTDEFIEKYCPQKPDNVEFIPFLQKEELEKEYKSCSAFILPSRQECWGLVINEAASFGVPVVSTYGSGAAVEFLCEKYPQFLAEPDSAESLSSCLERLLNEESIEEYSAYLKEKSKDYSIENSVKAHVEACEL